MKKIIIVLNVAILLLSLSSCGQSGRLYLPDPNDSSSKSAEIL